MAKPQKSDLLSLLFRLDETAATGLAALGTKWVVGGCFALNAFPVNWENTNTARVRAIAIVEE